MFSFALKHIIMNSVLIKTGAVALILFHSLFSAKAQQTRWVVDKMHSAVKFNVTHLVISEVEGSFRIYDGSMVSENPDFTNAKFDFEVDVNSINTDNSMRDNHLKSDDFFNAAEFPKMKFVSTSFKKKSGNNYTLTGDLTIRNITKKVSFTVVYGGTTKDGYGNTKAGFRATGQINRFDYNLKWNSVTEAGNAVVSKEVNLVLNMQFAQGK